MHQTAAEGSGGTSGSFYRPTHTYKSFKWTPGRSFQTVNGRRRSGSSLVWLLRSGLPQPAETVSE